MEIKFSNYWDFKSEQDKQDTIASIRACQPFLKHYTQYLRNREKVLYKKITEQALLESINWEDKLSSLIGEMRAITKELELLENFIDLS